MQPRCLAHTLFIRYEVIAARPSLSPATDQGQSIYPAHSEPDWNTRKHHNKEPDGLKLQLSHREDESDGQKQTCSVSGHLWPETQNGSSEAQQKNLLPTPAQTQKTLADEPGPNLSRHRHVGLPGLCEDPAEWCQEEKVQKGCRHDTDTLWMQEKKKITESHISRNAAHKYKLLSGKRLPANKHPLHWISALPWSIPEAVKKHLPD